MATGRSEYELTIEVRFAGSLGRHLPRRRDAAVAAEREADRPGAGLALPNKCDGSQDVGVLCPPTRNPSWWAQHTLRFVGQSQLGFTIVDRNDAEDLLNVLRTELELTKADKRFPLKGTCLDIYSRVVNTPRPLEQVLKETFPWVADQLDGLKKLFAAYTERKEEQQTLDDDDLLLFWHYLMTEPACRDMVRQKFDCVLVDEYRVSGHEHAASRDRQGAVSGWKGVDRRR